METKTKTKPKNEVCNKAGKRKETSENCRGITGKTRALRVLKLRFKTWSPLIARQFRLRRQRGQRLQHRLWGATRSHCLWRKSVLKIQSLEIMPSMETDCPHRPILPSYGRELWKGDDSWSLSVGGEVQEGQDLRDDSDLTVVDMD